MKRDNELFIPGFGGFCHPAGVLCPHCKTVHAPGTQICPGPERMRDEVEFLNTVGAEFMSPTSM